MGTADRSSYDSHESIRRGIANPHITRRLAKCPTGAMYRDAQATARLRIGCELAVLAALVVMLIWWAL